MYRRMRYAFTVLLSASLLAVALQCAAAQPSAAEERTLPGYPLARKPPESAVVLFSGKDLSNWRQPDGGPAAWKVEGGAMTVTNGNIVTVETFADAFIHVEFRTPNMPGVSGQGKGNSGVYVQGRYEIQVLDSYGINIPGKGDCGAIYGQYAPLVNVSRPPLAWQTYDIIFRAPRVDESGKMTERARITVLQNGIVIQNNVELPGTSAGALDENVGEPGPLLLQAHGSPVQYRNIWLVRLPPKASDAYEPR